MSRSVTRLAVLVALLLAGGGLTTAPAAADPVPGAGQPWPTCGVAPDTDHRYCVRVFFEDGSTPAPVDPAQDGSYVRPRVSFTAAGDVRFVVERVTVSDGELTTSREVDPGTQWWLGVNTGSFRPHATTGTLDDTSVGLGRDDDYDTWLATIDFAAPAVAWRDGPCHLTRCGDAGTRADREYAGYAGGLLTDRPGELGYISVSGAQVQQTQARPRDHAVVVRLASPRLGASGARAATSYLTYFTDPMLRRIFGVADPQHVRERRFVIHRIGSREQVDFSPVNVPHGLRFRIRDIDFSARGTAAYRIALR
jgi:hypothetical protein